MTNDAAMRHLIELTDPDTACRILVDSITDASESDLDFIAEPLFSELQLLLIDALSAPYDERAINYLTDAARIAFDDPTESTHAAHIRDALRGCTEGTD